MICNSQFFWNEVNNAINDVLTIGPVKNWNYAEQLRQKYDAQIEGIILSILETVLKLQPDWGKENYEGFLIRCTKNIVEVYPQLSQESVNVLVNRIAYDWK
ncbi:MAG: hypothetical protein IJO59_00470 [Clostridia bacterium]|nr:hypothetical protein [Clostridia bacterium]